MTLHWFNIVGLVMLILMLFSHEVVNVTVLHEAPFVLIPLAMAYMSTVLGLLSRKVEVTSTS